jgi:aminopeptidase N
MSKPAASTVTLRENYAPPEFLIDTVNLEFDLEPDRTIVRNTMRVRRNRAAQGSQCLRLHGEQLEFISASVSGHPCNVRLHGDGLSIDDVPEAFELTIIGACNPASNSALTGLYVSRGNFCTQCEAEGFRRITWFLDRPDVMATYTVTLRADKAEYPVLLSNGNLDEQGELPDGRHFAKWTDPFRKPSYLFALVAGKFLVLERRVKTGSGKEKLLQVWVEPQDIQKTHYAMDSLVRAIHWDEKRFGLELDLERFMIVAVSDFNMGAMENKGLNIFNTKAILANVESATDADHAQVESIVAHEYFHNWTGNRVTCRDWFQLSLKEGLTVFRDQEFSADMAACRQDPFAAGTARAVQRIEDVSVLRQVQFGEDAGPMAHPVRPESYAEINNFYTATVYRKGAEVVRMYQTLFGQDGFRRGMDLYFERYDGHAVTCDDFRRAMGDANSRDLSQFERWYSQAGTPRVRVTTEYDEVKRHYLVKLAQDCDLSPQAVASTYTGPLLIPFQIGLVGKDGADVPLRLDGEPEPGGPTRLLELTQEMQNFTFVDVPANPVPSLLRGFSAPVSVEYEYGSDELAFLLQHDSDPFNRWDAGQRLATREILALAANAECGRPIEMSEMLAHAYSTVLADKSLTSSFMALTLSLPTETYLTERMAVSNPGAVHTARCRVRRDLGRVLKMEWRSAYTKSMIPGDYEATPEAKGRRALKGTALSYLSELDDPSDAVSLALLQYDTANNMTDRIGALSALMNAAANTGDDCAKQPLAEFYERFKDDALVVDKWFSLQATQRGSEQRPVIEMVRRLMEHPAFTLKNPNRARSLIFGFCGGNPAQFHAPDGSGYEFWAEMVLELDSFNPLVASRLSRMLELWRRFTPALGTQMYRALERVASNAKSRDVCEVVKKALA